MDIDKKKVGLRIKSIRINRKESTADFAKNFDPEASDSLVSRWERGVNLPNNIRIKKIADLGDITVEELLYGKKLEAISQLYSLRDYCKSMTNTIEFDPEWYKDIEAIELAISILEREAE